MLQEFRDFINKGNVVDLAVAFVLGVAFKPIVDAIVERVLMPAIGVLVGQPNFDTLGTFACESIPAEGPTEGLIVTGGEMCAGSVGAVITAVTSFLLVAGALFLVVRAYNRLQRQQEVDAEEPDPGPSEIELLTEIRDALTK